MKKLIFKIWSLYTRQLLCFSQWDFEGCIATAGRVPMHPPPNPHLFQRGFDHSETYTTNGGISFRLWREWNFPPSHFTVARQQNSSHKHLAAESFPSLAISAESSPGAPKKRELMLYYYVFLCGRGIFVCVYSACGCVVRGGFWKYHHRERPHRA